VHCVANSDHSVEDAAEDMPARMPARPAESPRHECVSLAVVSPRRDGCAGSGCLSIAQARKSVRIHLSIGGRE
jgi:hypothetical protein